MSFDSAPLLEEPDSCMAQILAALAWQGNVSNAQ